MSMHIHCMSIHSLVCPPIILSVCPVFCPSVCPSIHPYVCNQIVKLAKSIAKSIEINWKSNITHKMRKILKRKLHWKAASLFVQTCFSKFEKIANFTISFFYNFSISFTFKLYNHIDHAIWKWTEYIEHKQTEKKTVKIAIFWHFAKKNLFT